MVLIRNQLSHILSSAGFILRKWSSNHYSVLEGLDCNSLEVVKLGDSDEIKTLGILWSPKADLFYFQPQHFTCGRVTKRAILSTIAKIYDPLGLIAPIVIIAKVIMQKLWQHKLNWDESIPTELHTMWLNFINDLGNLNNIKFNRHAFRPNYKTIELHGFCDASDIAYGACIYVKSIDYLGNSQLELLCAKSKVAPINKLSTPRLELCGALLLVRLLKKVRIALELEFQREYLWCDSSIVLCWLSGPCHKWKTFVANRVSEIQTLTQKSHWRHVGTHDNPADLISRGMNAHNLSSSKLWFSGPQWLIKDETHWPNKTFKHIDILPDTKNIQTSLIVSEISPFFIFSKYSSYIKLQRVTAYCFRFADNVKCAKECRKVGSLTNDELNKATIALVKRAQQECFGQEIRDLSNDKCVGRKSIVLSLNPYLDKDGLIRVGGRVNNSSFPYDKKHQIILPNKHPLTNLIICNEHIKQLHCGAEALLASVRNKYWPIAGRSLCKRVIHRCIKCFRVYPKGADHIMGLLPASRITSAFPFQTSGVDYAGPFTLKNRKGRGAKLSKVYICLFVCFTTKALHIELACDLTTECFIAAMRRFVARRGKPSKIYSDNGTNFVGANSELRELSKFINSNVNQDKIINAASQSDITWHFIPSRSPHFGGLWEAGVKSVKTHLKRVMGNTILTYEELYTCLTQIEAVLNSRPICPLSNDPNDLEALTPGHFLIGRPLTALPDPNLLETSENRLSRFQLLQRITQHFWKRWSSEYINGLQQRTKWKQKSTRKIQVNDLVLLREDNYAPLRWRLARVIQTHPGPDNVVRAVSVKTSSGVVKRAVRTVCILPMDD